MTNSKSNSSSSSIDELNNEKSVDGVLGIRTLAQSRRRMESTEL